MRTGVDQHEFKHLQTNYEALIDLLKNQIHQKV